MPGGRTRPVSKVSQPASVERPAGKLKSLCGLGRVSVISHHLGKACIPLVLFELLARASQTTVDGLLLQTGCK